MGAQFRVEVQGVSPDFGQANGSYDAVELGTLTAAGLAGLLQRVAALPLAGLLARSASEDVCWPNVIVHGPQGMHTFCRFDVGPCLHCEEAGGQVALGQAMRIVTGALWPPDGQVVPPADLALPGQLVAVSDQPPVAAAVLSLPGSFVGVSSAPPAGVPAGGPARAPGLSLPGTMVGISSAPPPGVPRPAFCALCGDALAADARFCAGCGHPVG